jgi:hypothetical protein
VSSPQSAYPQSEQHLNGGAAGADNQLGNDESLGGALLTPIPWLLNHTPSPSGPLTPGTEASSNTATATQPKGSDEGTVGSPENAALSEEEGEEVPHARGPEEIGVEDTGLQTGGKGGVEGLLESADKANAEAAGSADTMDVDKPASEEEEVAEEGKKDSAADDAA